MSLNNKPKTTGKKTKEIQNRIISYRKAKKISQDELAKLLNIPRSTYAYHENKATDLSINFIEDVANALNIPFNDLFPVFIRLNEPRPEQPKVESFVTTNFEQKLIEKYRMLPTEIRKEVRNFVDELYNEHKIKR